MAKEEKKGGTATKEPEKKGAVPSGLKPREAVKVSKEVFARLPKEVQEILVKLNEAREKGDKTAQREARKALRAKGFYLSNIENGGVAPEKKEKSAKTEKSEAKAETKAEADDDDEDEDDD